MASNLLGTTDIDQAFEELILEKTEGVPFFIEEFIKSLMSLGIIEKKDNTISLISDLQALTIPATIQDVIMARIDKLPEGAKEILQTGSVIEREFSYDLIKAVTGLPEQKLLSLLSALKDFELLYERGIYPQSAYVFRHALTQEVAYNSLLIKRRKEIHSKIAGAMELIYSGRLEEFYEKLADHYSRADESKKAYHYLKLSGNKSMRNHSNWEAFYSYKEANRILIKEDETDENLKRRFEILQLMIGPMRILGYPEDSAQLLQEGENLLNQVGEVKDLTHIYSTIGHYNITKGDSSLGLDYSEKSYQEAFKTNDINLIVKTGWYYCSAIYVTGRFVKLIELAQEVLDLLKKTKNEHESFGLGVNLYSGMLGFKGCAMGWLGNFQEGELLLDRGLNFASGIDDKTCLGLVEWFYGMFFLVKGNWKSATDHLQKAIKYLEERKFYIILGSAWMKLGLGYYYLRDLKKAKQCAEKGFTIHNGTGLNYWLSLSTFTLGLIDFDQGESKGAQKCLKEAIELAQNSNEHHIEGMSRIWLGRILGRIKPSQIDRAEEFILKGIEINKKLKIKPEYARGYLFLGELYLNTMEKEKAVKNLRRSEEMFKEMGMDYWLTQTREVLSRL
jgi:tetratricopeptide (TPR) repeat protein